MVALKALSRLRLPLILLASITLLPGCAEVRAIFSILFNGSVSLSTSAFEFDEIRSGTRLTCAAMGDKSVRCIGSGAQGNLGTYNGGAVHSIKSVKQLALGKGFTCYTEGERSQAFCLGKNDKGQLGNRALENSVDPVAVVDAEANNQPLYDVKEITAGESHACALLKSGRIVCWGDNSFGQGGNPKATNGFLKNVLDGEHTLKPFIGTHNIYAGGNSTCVTAKEDRTVFCFGEKFGATKPMNWVPEKIELAGSIGALIEIKQIAIGQGFACGLGKNSMVYCWGRNDRNQLGALTSLPGMTKASQVLVTYPQEMPLIHIEQIAAGESHACGLQRDEKTVFCWGDNRLGQLGNTSVRGYPEQVALGSNNLTLKGVKEVTAGGDHTCITSVRDELFCWGNGADGILGNDRVLSPYPVRVLDANGEMLSNVSQLAMGYDHTCVLDQTQKLYCYGLNTYGQLGFRAFSSVAISGDKTPLTKVTSIDTSHNRTCIVYGPDQTVACFGEKEIDNLNKRPEKNSFIAEEVRAGGQGFKGAIGVSIGKNHVCIVKSNQQVTCLGSGDVSSSSGSEVVMDQNGKPISDIWQIRGKEDWNCALTQEKGNIWCWGEWKGERWPNARMLPSNGKAASEFIQITMSEDQICGVRGMERELYCTKMGVQSPEKMDLEQVVDHHDKPMRKILSVSGGQHHLCAIDDDAHLYCWGQNDFGQLGTKEKHEVQKPTLLHFESEKLKRINRVTTGDHHTCVGAEGMPALYCFGESFYGSENKVEPIEYSL